MENFRLKLMLGQSYFYVGLFLGQALRLGQAMGPSAAARIDQGAGAAAIFINWPIYLTNNNVSDTYSLEMNLYNNSWYR